VGNTKDEISFFYTAGFGLIPFLLFSLTAVCATVQYGQYTLWTNSNCSGIPTYASGEVTNGDCLTDLCEQYSYQEYNSTQVICYNGGVPPVQNGYILQETCPDTPGDYLIVQANVCVFAAETETYVFWSCSGTTFTLQTCNDSRCTRDCTSTTYTNGTCSGSYTVTASAATCGHNTHSQTQTSSDNTSAAILLEPLSFMVVVLAGIVVSLISRSSL